jgi:Major Facilitator Superfamily
VPVGITALWLIYRHMPDYYGEALHPLDVTGLLLFGAGTALLSWLLEIFGEHEIDVTNGALLAVIAICLLAAYCWHARRTEFPLLRIDLFKVRTFRVSVLGGFITRLGVGGLPFLMPLLYQLALGLPAWQSGLLMMPTAAAAMCMKLISEAILDRFGYRAVLVTNTVAIGLTITLYSLVTPATPLPIIVALGLALGLFNSLQFSSINSMAYADIEKTDSSMASTIVSSLQQMSVSFSMAFGSLITAWFLAGLSQSDQLAVGNALHHAFLALGGLTILSSLSFWTLHANDGDSVSRSSHSPETLPVHRNPIHL